MVAREVPSITILAFGSGSTAEACIRATQNGRLRAQVGLVFGNNPSEAAMSDDLSEVARYGDT